MNRCFPVLLVILLSLCAGISPVEAGRSDASSAACGQTGNLPANCGNIEFDGDSISAGWGATPGHGLDSQFMQQLHVPARVIDVAVGGRPVAVCLRLFHNDVVPYFVPTARFNLIVFHAGDNDIAQGRNAEQTYAAFTHYVAQAHAQGWKVIVSTELRRFGFPSDRQALLADYNRRLLANAAGADAVVNLDSDPRFSDPATRNDRAIFSPDHIHPSDGGYSILAHMLVDKARLLLPR